MNIVVQPPKWRNLPSNLPRTQWKWDEIRNYPTLPGKPGGRTCDFCGTWLCLGHHIHHPDWPEVMVVGSRCARYAASVDAEALEQKFLERQREESRLAAEVERSRLEREEAARRQRERAELWAQREEEARQWQAEQARQRAEREHRRLQRIAQAQATRPARSEEIRQGICREVCEAGRTWHLNWRPSAKGFARSIDCRYFGIGCTLFRGPDDVPHEDRGFKYVLNMPSPGGTKFAPRWYDDINQALQAAYQAFRNHVADLLRRRPLEAWVYPGWRRYIETGVPPEEQEET
jgi:hypothetical protein